MSLPLPQPAKVPTMYFIGVSTAQSAMMRVFPEWARVLGLGEAVLKGIDLKIHADPQDYRQVVHFIRHDPLSLGAIITTHKIDLYEAARDSFDYLDPYARMFGELSSISKRDGKLAGHAKDPISAGLALEEFVPPGFWREHRGEVLLIGAGGSAIAIGAYLLRPEAAGNYPTRLAVSNRSRPRLDSIRRIFEAINPGIPIDYHLTPEPQDNDRVLRTLRPYSLVVNATGLGKDRPGSPLSDDCRFPDHSLVWEINYRGDLLFMRQALAQREARGLRVEDGWMYFIHGWTQVIAEVFHREIRGPLLAELVRCMDRNRQGWAC